MEQNFLVVSALRCLGCLDVIYSRAHHDMRYCYCQRNFVDGGFEYFRCGFKDPAMVQRITIKIPQTRKQLFDDWNLSTNQFGRLEQGCIVLEVKDESGEVPESGLTERS